MVKIGKFTLSIEHDSDGQLTFRVATHDPNSTIFRVVEDGERGSVDVIATSEDRSAVRNNTATNVEGQVGRPSTTKASHGGLPGSTTTEKMEDEPASEVDRPSLSQKLTFPSLEPSLTCPDEDTIKVDVSVGDQTVSIEHEKVVIFDDEQADSTPSSPQITQGEDESLSTLTDVETAKAPAKKKRSKKKPKLSFESDDTTAEDVDYTGQMTPREVESDKIASITRQTSIKDPKEAAKLLAKFKGDVERVLKAYPPLPKKPAAPASPKPAKGKEVKKGHSSPAAKANEGNAGGAKNKRGNNTPVGAKPKPKPSPNKRKAAGKVTTPKPEKVKSAPNVPTPSRAGEASSSGPRPALPSSPISRMQAAAPSLHIL